MKFTINGTEYDLTTADLDNIWGELTKAARARILPTLTPAKRPGFARSYTDEQAAQAREMWAEGYTRRAIAEKLGLSASCVQRLTQEEA